MITTNNSENINILRIPFILFDKLFSLFKNKQYLKFYPTPEMSRKDKILSLIRFFVYFVLLIIAFGKDNNWIIIAFFSLSVILFVRIISHVDPNEKYKDTKNDNEIIKQVCTRPNYDNPFMNPNVTQYSDPDETIELPEACNSFDEDISDDMKIGFNHGLFQNIDELYDRVNSQRQFYTVPNTTIPNNQKEFGEWLYKVPAFINCKEKQGIGCLRYEDLRFKR